jgi:TrkA domain protein
VEHVDIHIREQRLPGIGSRYDLDVAEHRVLSVVARTDGSRELAVRAQGADETAVTVPLSREQAVAVAALLTGARFSIGPARSRDASVDVGTVVVGPRSPAVGLRADEIPLPAGSEAAVLAVISDETPDLIEGDPERRCQPGDRLVVAARPDRLSGVLAGLAG